ncbi:MAG: SpoVK/Ycf46/Vps4 family AAA+-type ATPase, partial [Myxococcota bacterium]
EPTIELEHVILTDRVRRTVLDILENHDAYRERLQEWGYPDVLPSGKGIALLFSGPPGTGKTRFANAVARHLGKRLLRVRCAQLRESPDAIEPVLDELVRESVVQDGIVFFDDCEALFGDRSAKLSALLEFMESYESIMILATNRPQTLDAALERRIIHQVDFEVPGPLLREQLWELHLPPGAPVSGDIDVPALATAYNFAGGTIKNAVLMAINKALARDPEQPKLDMALLEAAANAQLRYRLEDFTRVTVTPLTLKDVVLPEEQRESVAEVLAACRSRTRILNEWGFGKRLVTGKGIVILFDGPPGTGKTLTAEILANELGKSLYRVDVPSVVSKYIGETEKHLVEIFDRARASRSMLLFDEADSLFGRRVEARSSTDRYANMEVNLLLQEIERFEGIIMLTTNLFGGLDDAVRRRISYRVTFPEPDVDARRLIWRSLLPSEAPLDDDVDLQLLARTFDISGGLIKNAVLRGAHRAMDDGTAISMRHLLEAGREECRSAGKVVRVVPKAAKPTPVSEAS